MENVSKALMIAGGIMIAIIVVSILAFGFTRLRKYQNSQDENVKVMQIAEYNKKFDSYNKNVVKGYEIVSLSNLAYDTNKRYSEDDGFKQVKIGAKLTPKNGGNAKPKFVGNTINVTGRKEYVDMINYVKVTLPSLDSNSVKEFKELYFQCDDIEYDTTGKIIGMYFSQIHKKE